MKITNMLSPRSGTKVANQFIITEEGRGALGNFTKRETFQSYETLIARRTVWEDGSIDIELDINNWDYSMTTGKYRNIFLGESRDVTEKKIASGEYKLTDMR